MSDNRRMRAAAASLCVVLVAAGCFNGRLPARELYRLSVPPAATGTTPGGPLAGGIEVARYITPGLYGDGNIVFRTNEHEYAVYPSREWGIPLGEMLGLIAQSALERAPLTSESAIYDPPPTHDLPYLWRGVVREFEEINRGKEVFVGVRLDAQLIRRTDHVLLWRGSQRIERPVPKPTMAAIVAELSALATEATDALVAEARASVGAGAAVSSQPER